MDAFAQAAAAEVRARRSEPPRRLAVATSAAIRTLRDRARAGRPVPADDRRIAAAHAAGLTLDDIHEVFGVEPREAVRAIAAHAGR
ncbi:hypothetical protein [Methylobacterium aquaticum]|nr:hypothetical protein [Methylobacterium aquaticum]